MQPQWSTPPTTTTGFPPVPPVSSIPQYRDLEWADSKCTGAPYSVSWWCRSPIYSVPPTSLRTPAVVNYNPLRIVYRGVSLLYVSPPGGETLPGYFPYWVSPPKFMTLKGVLHVPPQIIIAPRYALPPPPTQGYVIGVPMPILFSEGWQQPPSIHRLLPSGSAPGSERRTPQWGAIRTSWLLVQPPPCLLLFHPLEFMICTPCAVGCVGVA